MDTEPLHLVELTLDIAELVARGRRQGLPLREVDEGYLIHAWLTAAFGEGAPQPWGVVWTDGPRPGLGRHFRILGYGPQDAAALRVHADAYASPSDHGAADWSSLRSRPMPVAFAPGLRLGLEVRVVPTVRQKEREVDAFIAEVARVGEEVPLRREDVYADWLRAAVGRIGAGELSEVQMTDFRLRRVLRRTQGEDRRAPPVVVPDATLKATLTVGPKGVGELLRRGIGRHRAFGFGMVRLRPPPKEG